MKNRFLGRLWLSLVVVISLMVPMPAVKAGWFSATPAGISAGLSMLGQWVGANKRIIVPIASIAAVAGVGYLAWKMMKKNPVVQPLPYLPPMMPQPVVVGATLGQAVEPLLATAPQEVEPRKYTAVELRRCACAQLEQAVEPFLAIASQEVEHKKHNAVELRKCVCAKLEKMVEPSMAIAPQEVEPAVERVITPEFTTPPSSPAIAADVRPASAESMRTPAAELQVEPAVVQLVPEARSFAANGKEYYELILHGKETEIVAFEQGFSAILQVAHYLFWSAQQQGKDFTQGTFKVYDPHQRMHAAITRCPETYTRASSHLRPGLEGRAQCYGLDIPAGALAPLPHGFQTLLVWHDDITRFTYIKPEDKGFSVAHPIDAALHAVGWVQSAYRRVVDPVANDLPEYRKERVPQDVVAAWKPLAQVLGISKERSTLVEKSGISEMVVELARCNYLIPAQKPVVRALVDRIAAHAGEHGFVYGRMGREVDAPVVSGANDWPMDQENAWHRVRDWARAQDVSEQAGPAPVERPVTPVAPAVAPVAQPAPGYSLWSYVFGK